MDKKFLVVKFGKQNKKIEVHQINVKAVTQVIKDRFDVDSPDIKYYDVDVDDWVDLEEGADVFIMDLRVLKLRVESSSDEDRLDTPETPVKVPGTPVKVPGTPVSRPETPISRPQTPNSRPQTPVSRPQTPVSRPQTPVSRPHTPVTRPLSPMEKTCTPSYQIQTSKDDIGKQRYDKCSNF
jgi:hypothetical protein